MFPKFNPSYIGNKMTKNKMSVRAMRDFEKDLKDDILMEESLVIKVVPMGETHTERVLREEGEYARNTGRCGLSSEQLNGNLLDS
jgi:hypothetical protein